MMNSLDELLDLAFEDYNLGQFDSAEQKIRKALIISPTHGDAFYLLGLIAYRKGIFTQAYDLLNLAVKAYPQQKNYQLALAEVYQHNGDLEKAKKIYQKFMDEPSVQIQMGWIALAEKKITQAKKIFTQLLNSNYQSQALHGLAFCVTGDKRLSYLQQSFQIKKTSQVANDLATCYLEKNRVKELVLLTPYMSDVHIKARILMSQGNYKAAEVLLKEALSVRLYDKEATLLLAQTYEKLSDWDNAQITYQNLISLDSRSLDGHKGLARLMMRAGDMGHALDHYQIVIKTTPNDTEVLSALAFIQQETKDYAEALGLYFKLLTMNVKKLNHSIAFCIQQLYQTDKKLAKRFAKGWVKNYPQNKVAQKLLKSLTVFLLCFITSGQAQSFSENQMWNLSWHMNMARMGDPQSQFELGEIFEQGKMAPKNLEKALEYYQQAAQQDYLPAMLKLGNLLRQDSPIQDTKKSLLWYTRAAEQGEIQAQLYLAEFYQKSNPTLANQWRSKAMSLVFPESKKVTP